MTGRPKPRNHGERSRSIRIGIVEPAKQRQQQDLEVEKQRPVLDVIEIVADALLDRGVAAQTVYLRPAGHAGPNLVPKHVLRNVLAELLDEDRPLRTRPDEAHLT